MNDENKLDTFKVIASEMFDKLEVGFLNIKKGETFEKNSDVIIRNLHALISTTDILSLFALKNTLLSIEKKFEVKRLENSCSSEDIDMFLFDISRARVLLENDANPISIQDKSKKKGLIYLIDDEPDILEGLDELITPHGFETKKFNNGKEAVIHIKQDQPDAIISDINMPNMNGMEFLKYCSSKAIDVPIIFVSGYVTKEMMFEGFDHGAYAFIEKPFDENRLLTTCLTAAKKNQTQKLLNKSINFILYQFGDINELLALYGHEDVRQALKTDIEAILEQRKKLKNL